MRAWQSWFALVAALTLVGAGRAPAECRRITPDAQIGHVTAGAWRPDGAALLLVDRLAGGLKQLDREGHLSDVAVRGTSSARSASEPLDLASTEAGFLLQDGLHRLLWLDPELTVVKGADSGGRVAILEPLVVGDQVFVYGTATAAEGQPWGFFEVGRDDLAVDHLVRAVGRQGAHFASLSRPMLAEAGGAAYALDYGPPAGLRRLSAPAGELEAFPSGYRTLPRFPPRGGPETIELMYRALESASVPAQLYGRGDRLYLLTRRPSVEGGVDWRLHRIDPGKDAVEASLPLPTHSPHVLLVPGEPTWAVIELERPRLGGRQDVRDVLLVPATWVNGAAPSPLANAKHPDCH